MKTVVKTIIAMSLALFVSMTLSAQPGGKKLTREELAVKQAGYISRELAFDEKTSKKFEETYCNFQQELWALGPGLGKQQSGIDEEGYKTAFRPQPENTGSPQEILRHLQYIPHAEADITRV